MSDEAKAVVERYERRKLAVDPGRYSMLRPDV